MRRVWANRGSSSWDRPASVLPNVPASRQAMVIPAGPAHRVGQLRVCILGDDCGNRLSDDAALDRISRVGLDGADIQRIHVAVLGRNQHSDWVCGKAGPHEGTLIPRYISIQVDNGPPVCN